MDCFIAAEVAAAVAAEYSRSIYFIAIIALSVAVDERSGIAIWITSQYFDGVFSLHAAYP